MKKFNFIPALAMLLFFVSCTKSNSTVDDNVPKSWTENRIVASKTVIADEQDNFWIKRNGNPVWQRVGAYVTGFDYVEGYEYDIDFNAVEVPEPPEDAPTVRYSLIRVNSKVQKDSDVPTLYREMPAGTSSYRVGEAHNIEHYDRGNPVEVNMTTYGIDPIMTQLQ